MKISTSSNELKKWMSMKRDIPKIIFSTYQSSPVIKKSLKKNQIINFAVFDEAHRTATVNQNLKSNFSFALFNENIKIEKRLFMTATRRISNNKKLKKEGDATLSLSMESLLEVT